MRDRVILILTASLLVIGAPSSEAISVGMADSFFPTYGSATHFDQSNEYLGALGDMYDGVVYPFFAPGQTATITVSPTVGDLFGTGDFEFLSVWIDWDQSRTWDLGEEVVDLDDEYFALGTNPRDFTIQVPDHAVYGETWMRARFSFDGDLLPFGEYFTGEVEDYRVTVIPEPGTGLLLSLVLSSILGLGVFRRGGRDAARSPATGSGRRRDRPE